MFTSFYTIQELKELGLLDFGKDVLISRKCSIYSPDKISIGNNVRIDDFCLLSGSINLKNNIHISAFCALYGSGGIVMEDYTGLSPRCTLLSATDDFSGEYFIGPLLESELTNITRGCIRLNSYSQLGANTVVMPNVTIGQGSVTGAMTFVNKSLGEWGIYAGIPARKIKERSRNLLKLVK